jgi:hypothetical protein
VHPDSVLLITLDSCRYDTFRQARLQHLRGVGPLHKAQAPGNFTYASHAAMWVGFTPGVASARKPWLNPKMGRVFRLSNAGFARPDSCDAFTLQGASIVEGFVRQGYRTIGTGAVGWFDARTPTGQLLSDPFERFWFSGAPWHLRQQLSWIDAQLAETPPEQPSFVFLNVGETHVPYWHEGADWPQWPSPCLPFGGDAAKGERCSRRLSRRRQRRCLEWVDAQLGPLLQRFAGATVLVCADHGDCWGEDGLWEHGISHWATLTVPLLLRVRGAAVGP